TCRRPTGRSFRALATRARAALAHPAAGRVQVRLGTDVGRQARHDLLRNVAGRWSMAADLADQVGDLQRLAVPFALPRAAREAVGLCFERTAERLILRHARHEALQHDGEELREIAHDSRLFDGYRRLGRELAEQLHVDRREGLAAGLVEELDHAHDRLTRA